MTRRATALLALLAAAGCVESVATCPTPGEGRLPDGTCGPLDDAGRDTGASDTGARDAGPDTGARDAGPDTGSDTGPADAGPCPGGCTGVRGMCSGTLGCVECLGHGDCTDAVAARCDGTGTCVGCGASPECAGVTGAGGERLEVCDPTAMRCVECLGTETAACVTNHPCNPVTNRCSAYARGTRRACETCDTDLDCPADHDCVPMQWMGADRPEGYCLKDDTGGCTEPFTITLTGRTSLSGRTGARYCGINEALTTCEAVRALLDDAMCPGGLDSECPEGGLCRRVGSLNNRCTYACGGVVECDAVPRPGSTCGAGSADGGAGGGDGGVPVDYCGG